MPKDSWSARIDTELKREIQSYIKNSKFTNEDLVKSGYEALKNSQKDLTQTSDATEYISKNLFAKNTFNIDNFQEIDISSLNDNQLKYMLIRISFYKPFDTLLLMKSNRHFYVKNVDKQKDDISFKIIEEDIDIDISLQEIINDRDKIKSIYKLKRDTSNE